MGGGSTRTLGAAAMLPAHRSISRVFVLCRIDLVDVVLIGLVELFISFVQVTVLDILRAVLLVILDQQVMRLFQ